MRSEGSVARFRDRNVVVTGGSSGIGAATVQAFVEEGARVVAVARDRERLERVRAAAPERISTLEADLATLEAAGAVVERALEVLGRLDVVVNAAGVALDGTVLDTSDEVWRATMAVNLDAAFVLSRAASRHMVDAGGGVIVNVASVDGIVPEAPLVAYNASKAALISLTRTFALELGHRGIRVNAVAPGETVTAMTEADVADPAFRSGYLPRIPMHRFAEAGEIAAPILFLASEEASFVNGATLVVDGGQLAGSWYYPSERPEPNGRQGDREEVRP